MKNVFDVFDFMAALFSPWFVLEIYGRISEKSKHQLSTKTWKILFFFALSVDAFFFYAFIIKGK